MQIEDDRTKSWTSEGKWTEEETRTAEGVEKQNEIRRADPWEAKIEAQLEKINGKIETINAAIEELTRRVFAGGA